MDFEDLSGEELQLLSEGSLFSELLEELFYRPFRLDLFFAALRFLTGLDPGLELSLDSETGAFFLRFFLLYVGVSAGALARWSCKKRRRL